MAKTPRPASNAAVSPASSTNDTPRVTKARPEGSRSSHTTRQRSKVLAMQSMVTELGDERHAVADSSSSQSYRGKGKGKVVETDNENVHKDEDIGSWGFGEPELCSVTDTDTKPFPIMELPTEIRLEIYRACLTRPYNILLSKREQPAIAKEDKDGYSSGSGPILDSASSDDDDVTQRAGNSNSNQTMPSRRLVTRLRSVSTRSTRPSRLTSRLSEPGPSSVSTGTTSTDSGGTHSTILFRTTSSSRSGRRVTVEQRRFIAQPEPERNQTQDPLITNVLRASREIYKEGRSVLYSENHFVLDLNTAMQTLGNLHQRSRRQIKHVELEIPTYNEILERFQETVRLSLRYCSGLKTFIIHMPFTLPGADGSGTTGNTTVYANGFDILRWLPQECDIIVKGNICVEIETVVNKHLHLAKTLDKLAYARRQLISNETSSSSPT